MARRPRVQAVSLNEPTVSERVPADTAARFHCLFQRSVSMPYDQVRPSLYPALKCIAEVDDLDEYAWQAWECLDDLLGFVGRNIAQLRMEGQESVLRECLTNLFVYWTQQFDLLSIVGTDNRDDRSYRVPRFWPAHLDAIVALLQSLATCDPLRDLEIAFVRSLATRKRHPVASAWFLTLSYYAASRSNPPRLSSDVFEQLHDQATWRYHLSVLRESDLYRHGPTEFWKEIFGDSDCFPPKFRDP